MKTAKMLETFNDRYPLLGPALWISSLQYFIVQLAVALNFAGGYSLSRNTISDLGNTVCGAYGGRFVCSPDHGLMNLSFVVLGLTMMAGAPLIYQEFREGRTAITGFAFMAIAGFGTVLVGLFPENTVSALHITGAALPFFIGNLGLVILGASLSLPRWLRIYTILTGLWNLLALALLMTNHYLGLGQGGIERLTAYPQTIWLIVFGLYMGKKRFRAS
ncbi:MAG TPA: DUF998 domain-containing protein [Candidatus Saccharimonadia bacterium]|nr:DUF998 domain-containing protein [Candidatus Saccharimonadia bacterium]